MWIVAAILVLFVLAVLLTKAPLDLAMVGTLVLLVLTGQVDPSEAFLGFSNPAVLMIAALFVVANGLRQTGAIDRLAPKLIGRPMSVRGTIGRICLPVTILSGFMNNTPLIAMFLPVATDHARRLGVSPSRLLIPLSFAGILGGQLTLVGTSSNLLVDGLYWTSSPRGRRRASRSIPPGFSPTHSDSSPSASPAASPPWSGSRF